jgi:hypothetical protein
MRNLPDVMFFYGSISGFYYCSSFPQISWFGFMLLLFICTTYSTESFGGGINTQGSSDVGSCFPPLLERKRD